MQPPVPDNPSSRRKVGQVLSLIESHLAGASSFHGAVVTDSVARGDARPDSDVDMFLLFSPLDLTVIPGDFIWSPLSDRFYGRGENLPDDPDLLHIDARRVDLERLRAGGASELERHLLASGLLIYDRQRACREVITAATRYPDRTRRERLVDGFFQVSYHLQPDKAFAWYERADGRCAHAHFLAGVEYFIKFLFAWHRSWLTWPNKRVQFLLDQVDPVGGLGECFEQILLTRDFSRAELARRMEALGAYMDRMRELLQASGILPDCDPVEWAYGQIHPEIGLRHSMDAWRLANAARLDNNQAGAGPARRKN